MAGIPQTINEWTWVKVATAVTTGIMHRLSTVVYYYQTYITAGEAAPTAPTIGTLPEGAVRIFEDGNNEPISSSDPIDVYIMVKYRNTISGRDGKIRVDV